MCFRYAKTTKAISPNKSVYPINLEPGLLSTGAEDDALAAFGVTVALGEAVGVFVGVLVGVLVGIMVGVLVGVLVGRTVGDVLFVEVEPELGFELEEPPL